MPSDRQAQIQFGVVTPVGRNPIEAERLQDLVDSLEHHEPGRYLFVLVNDGLEPSLYRPRLKSLLGDRLVEIDNPRQGQGNGWAGGGATAVLAGLEKMLTMLRPDFVLKIDTDALVIAPFATKIQAIIHANPRVGMIGNVGGRDFSEDGFEQLRQLGRGVDKLMKQLTVWRKTPVGGPKVQVGFFGDSRVIRDTLRLALINGACIHEHCRGGAYALSGDCCEALRREGLLRKPTIWLRTPLADDRLVTFCTYRTGFRVYDSVSRDEPFAVQWRGLPAQPAELISSGHSIIHSVKDFGDFREAQTRAFFRASRDLKVEAEVGE